MRSRVDHAGAVGDAGVLRAGGGVLRHRGGLPRQGAFQRRQARGLEEAGVRAHGVPGGQHEHVARHEVTRRDDFLGPAAAYPHAESRELPQRVHGALGASLLERSHDGVRQEDREDDGGVGAFPQRQRDGRGDEQQVDEGGS